MPFHNCKTAQNAFCKIRGHDPTRAYISLLRIVFPTVRKSDLPRTDERPSPGGQAFSPGGASILPGTDAALLPYHKSFSPYPRDYLGSIPIKEWVILGTQWRYAADIACHDSVQRDVMRLVGNIGDNLNETSCGS